MVKMNFGAREVFDMDHDEFGQGISPIVFDSSNRSMEIHDILIDTYGNLYQLTLHMGTLGTRKLA